MSPPDLVILHNPRLMRSARGQAPVVDRRRPDQRAAYSAAQHLYREAAARYDADAMIEIATLHARRESVSILRGPCGAKPATPDRD